MPQVLPISLLRAALGAVLAAAIVLATLAPPAPAAPTPVTVRIEGLNSTILPETAVTTDTRAVPTMAGEDCFFGGPASSGLPYTASGATPVGALADGATIAGVTYDLTDAYVGSLGLGLCRIGSEPSDDAGFWNLKINHVYFLGNIGTDQLGAGDRVLWYRTSLYPAPTLDLVAPAKAQAGSQFSVTASAYDDAGRATPATGATVRFESQKAAAGPSGEAAFTAPSPGLYQMSAEKADAIRSPTYTVCVFDPALGVCDTTPVAAAAAPSAKIAKPVDGRIYGKIRKIAGVVEGDLAGVSAVRLRVKRIRQRRCTRWHDRSARFASVKRRLKSSSCAKPGGFEVPVGAGGKWSYRFKKALSPGVYSVNARAIGSGGGLETTIRDGVNRVRFGARHRRADARRSGRGSEH